MSMVIFDISGGINDKKLLDFYMRMLLRRGINDLDVPSLSESLLDKFFEKKSKPVHFVFLSVEEALTDFN